MTDYIAKIQTNGESQTIGGYNFDNTEVSKYTALADSATYSAGAKKTFDLSSLLPNDGYDYEVQFTGYANTGTTSGNAVSLYLGSGSSVDNTFTVKLGRCNTRVAGQGGSTGGVAKLPILASDRKVTYYNLDSSGTSSGTRIFMSSYKIIGKNGTINDYIGNVQINNQNIPIGGNVFNGKFTYSDSTIASGVSLAASGGTATYSLSSYLPNDGCDYDVLLSDRVVAATATAGKYASLRLGSGSSNLFYRFLNEVKNGTAATRDVTRTTIITIRASDKSLKFANSGSSVATLYAYLRGYRRRGTNSANSNYLQNIQVSGKTIPIGGNNFDGQWVLSGYSLFSGTTFSTTGTTKTYSLSSYLPNDGYDYEVLMHSYCRTGATSGNWVTMQVGALGKTSAGVHICHANTRSAASACEEGTANLWVPASNRNLTIYMTLSGTTGNCGIAMIGYRRLGTNT